MNVRMTALGGLVAAAALMMPAVSSADRIVQYEIDTAPPPPRVEVVPAPRSGYVYEPGHWRYDGNAYVWADGRFIAERQGHKYVPPVVEHRGEHYVFRSGHWDDDD